MEVGPGRNRERGSLYSTFPSALFAICFLNIALNMKDTD